MSELDRPINLKQLLKQHQQIQIPIIQRDYAQGRTIEQEIRNDFLDALYNALMLPVGHELLPLNLDFVYGSVEDDEESRFLPLDGQQRLTTLFLLHWYLSWKEGYQEEFKKIFLIENTPYSKFSYRIRRSSKEFFDAMVKYSPSMSVEKIDFVTNLIKDQPWYFLNWRLDATVQSSLTMLDAIHERFRDSDGQFFCRLVDEDQPVITFQLLNLKNFDLNDDLYIKMNARGIPLTSFETFKARYGKFLASEYQGELRNLDSRTVPVSEYFARRMDTKWADFFWSHRNSKTNLYDDAVMNLIRAIALITRNANSDSYIKDLNTLRNNRIKSTYSEFDGNKWLDRRLTDTLFLLLETWSANENGDFSSQLPNLRYFDEGGVFKKAVSDPTNLRFVEIIQFTAYVFYLQKHTTNIHSREFQEWMRVVFNLSNNTVYDRPSDIQRSIISLGNIVKNLGSNFGETLRYFADSNKQVTGFNEQQIAEEKLKAKLMLKDNRWRDLILAAEGHDYFRGQIEFLLEFCGVFDKWQNSEDVDWENAVHSIFQEKFQTYLRKAILMFDSGGLINKGEYRWERALLSFGDYLLRWLRNYSFLTNSPTEPASWKRLLRGGRASDERASKSRNYLLQLLNCLDENENISNQLDNIISKAQNLQPLQQEIVRTPEAIEYCKNRSIRIDNDKGIIYLLKTTQMNGKHAELFTYCLFHNQLSDSAAKGRWQPLVLDNYFEVVGTDDEPGIRFKWSHAGRDLSFNIEREREKFIMFISLSLLRDHPEVINILCNSEGFKEKRNRLEKTIHLNNVPLQLDTLVESLTTNFE